MIGTDFRRALFRTYVAAVVACLPILVLLLTPGLMQACVIYLVLCLGVAWYGTRLRTLSVEAQRATTGA